MVLLHMLLIIAGLTPDVLVILGLASIVFLSTVVIVAALMLRSRWGDIGDPKSPRP